MSRDLRRWFRRNQRPLPWRKDRDPYRVWVAEVLLQQTRIAQAIPYYERFLRRFPTVQILARARPDSVLRVWAGAGYYARARNLHAAARSILRDHAGRIPEERATLRALPGFGPYIASAVESLAFGHPVLALEANGVRVAARLLGATGRIDRSSTRNRLRRWLERGLPARDSRSYNEALMELGEEVCRPRLPRCPECPLEAQCVARRRYRDPGALPRRRPPAPKPHVEASIALLESGDRLFLQRRPTNGLLGGLWELPGGKREGNESAEATCRRELLEELGVRPRQLRRVGVVDHSYSHFSVALTVFRAPVPSTAGRAASGGSGRWVLRSELPRYPIPMATRKALELAGIMVTAGPSPGSVSRPGRRRT